MYISREKATEVIGALHAAEHALLEIDAADRDYGVVAGRCAVAAVYLDTGLNQDVNDAYEALRLVASHVVLPSGVRAVVEVALAKAGIPVPESVQHIRIVGEGV